MQLPENVAEEISEFREKRDSDDLNDTEKHGLWKDTRQEIHDLFLDEEWDLSERTLQKEVQEALDPIRLPADDEELEGYFEEVIDELRTKSSFTAYIYFPELVELPVGTEIGRMEIIEQPSEKERLMDHMEHMFNGDDHYTKLYEDRTWARFEFDSSKRRAYIHEELFDQIQVILGALKISIGRVSSPEDLAGGIYGDNGTIWFLEPDHEPMGWTKYDERVAEPTLSKLSEILKKNGSDRTPLEENLLGSIRLLTLHNQNYRDEHSFLTLVGALEGLLVSKYERPKAGKMAEKTVQLLYPDESDSESEVTDYSIEDKIDDYDRIKNWYSIRSEIIHGGYQSVTREEVRDLERTVEQVAKEMVKLTDEYYSLQKQGGENNPYRGLNEEFLEKRLRTSAFDQ